VALLYAHDTTDEVWPGVPGPVVVRTRDLARIWNISPATGITVTVGKDHIVVTGRFALGELTGAAWYVWCEAGSNHNNNSRCVESLWGESKP
jgi:hypothetical protein